MLIYYSFKFFCSFSYITFQFHQTFLNIFLHLQELSLLRLSFRSALIYCLNIAFDLFPKVIDTFGNMRTLVVFMAVNEANSTNNCFAIGTVYIQDLLFMKFTNTGSLIDSQATIILIYFYQFMLLCQFKFSMMSAAFFAILLLAINTEPVSCPYVSSCICIFI